MVQVNNKRKNIVGLGHLFGRYADTYDWGSPPGLDPTWKHPAWCVYVIEGGNWIFTVRLSFLRGEYVTESTWRNSEYNRSVPYQDFPYDRVFVYDRMRMLQAIRTRSNGVRTYRYHWRVCPTPRIILRVHIDVWVHEVYYNQFLYGSVMTKLQNLIFFQS